ncbi:PREDICTED: enhancer of mRNA-decapping protein 4 [Dufourea novaeangliae]|uniref:Enhancer of mRNA-decapping protein 4 n=1 Tax=Dufourea novaeangliae TaxID=178035 RepID=A0A154PGB8_DUFNO|nr:PREDICTED: enhancer of mRNA-decapping protein 4 [Dufourea novaeangliae]KZC10882.1 Enhancer of mRNA-decapping protein 4 [Dufourea novaeangliae]
MIKTGEDNLRHLHCNQTVEFSGQEDQYSVELYGNDVTVIPSSGGHNHGSSKVKIKNIVDYSWDVNLYPNQLLAVHMSGKYLAYGITVATGGGRVRVMYQELEQRALLREMRARIQDLAFAHVSNVILACVDYLGNLFIYTIESTPSELLCNLLLQVDAEPSVYHRVIWCPYIPEDVSSDGDEVSKLLVLIRGSKAELWSVNTVTSRFRSIEATDPAAKENGGMFEIDEHSGTIIEATFSPDGTALATASSDGEVKFFQVHLHDNSHGNQVRPRCLHHWRPHGGRPISCLFFLDDHKTYHPDVQFWRFAVTGCDNNTELKVWSCELWTCLQTITFAPTPSTGKLPVLKAALDPSAGYLLLSDLFNRVLYILSLTKDNGEASASVSTISQLLLPYPILCFGIVDAGLRKIRSTGGSLEDLRPCEEEADEQLVIKMYLVQPRSLQECHIAFKPVSETNNKCLMDTLARDALECSEDFPEMGTANHNGIAGENCEEDRSLSATIETAANHNAGLNLMTPDAFSSPAKKENNELDSRSGSPELSKGLAASPSLAQAVQALNAAEPPLVTSELEEQAPASSGSSPSREVRDILSLTKLDEEPEVENKPDVTDTADGDWSNIPRVLLKDVSRHAMQEAEDYTGEEEKRTKLINESKSATHTSGGVKYIYETTNEFKHGLVDKLEVIIDLIQEARASLRMLYAEITKQETSISDRIESTLALANQQQKDYEQILYSLIKLETAIKDKIEITMPRVIKDTVEPLKHQLRLDTARMDELLKENLTELINSAHVKDTLAIAAANAVKPALDIAFKEAFTNVLLPGMEKACQTMFRQVQDSFARGTQEYLQSVEAIIDKQYQQRNKQQSEALSGLVREELQAELSRGLTSLQEGTLHTIRESIRDNLNHQLNEITNARSRATTPAIPVPAVADAQSRVMSLLLRGQLNAAFQQALSASDLGLVVLVCEKTEPARVFSCPVGPDQGPRCILQQPVILSLVQQLSADLGHRTELKHRWLEEAILNLDPNNPVTREHMGTVLMTLQSQLAAFIAANPNHSSTRRMKMLAMAARALLNQHP